MTTYDVAHKTVKSVSTVNSERGKANLVAQNAELVNICMSSCEIQSFKIEGEKCRSVLLGTLILAYAYTERTLSVEHKARRVRMLHTNEPFTYLLAVTTSLKRGD